METLIPRREKGFRNDTRILGANAECVTSCIAGASKLLGRGPLASCTKGSQ
jgi:hypothetical protein